MWGVIVGGILAISGGVISQLVSHYLDHRNALKDAKIRAYRTISGLRVVFAQVMVSRNEADIMLRAHMRRWELTGSKSDSEDLTQTRRWMETSEGLVKDVSDIRRQITEATAELAVLFPNEPDVLAGIDKVDAIGNLEIEDPPASLSMDQVIDWAYDSVKTVQATIDVSLTKPINDLLEKVRPFLGVVSKEQKQ